jgi:hypothetical protein
MMWVDRVGVIDSTRLPKSTPPLRLANPVQEVARRWKMLKTLCNYSESLKIDSHLQQADKYEWLPIVGLGRDSRRERLQNASAGRESRRSGRSPGEKKMP